MKPGQSFDPWPDPTRSLSVVKQILNNGLIVVPATCQESQTVLAV